ncbi:MULTISPECIES: GerMN domain-containing protein [Paenibacillus]|uniref:GerMN domain-containing protein n=1 Tax=Paenibacillus TaxID=44249 RepID=UPI002FE062A1
MKKIGLSAMLLLVLVVSACGQKPETEPNAAESPQTGVTAPGTVSPVTGSGGAQEEPGDQGTGKQLEETPKALTQKIKVYYTDDELMELKTVEKEIGYTEESQKYNEAFKALQTPDDGMISLWDKITLNSVRFSKGKITLDVTIPDEARLGAGGESLAIDALKQTFFQFDEVKELELTIDGEQQESMMGHVELEHPFKK